MATYYKAKVGSLAGLEKHEIIHFGYMDTDSDEVIIKRKPWSKDVYKYDVHIAESLINQRLLRNVCYIMVGSVQMILVGCKLYFSDCYVQRVFTQMGLLKAIKYSTFEVSVLKEIVDGWIVRMNISGMDFSSFYIALIE